ncbi:MAG: hypothetical protein LC798_10850 [Chloroflexi bacterium]|nr:hypothetical protein [Chloroflexota bacterium]
MRLRADASGFKSDAARGIDSAVGPVAARSGKKAGKSFMGGFGPAVAAGAAAATVGLVKGLARFVGDARESARVGKLTAQIIKSTGGAAKVTAAQVDALATSISNKTGRDDEAIQSGANLLLTFKNVRNEVGRGNDIFNQATASAVDLAAAGFGSIESASKMLGKALNDPIKGMAALGRAGVTFTAAQEKQIKALVKAGDVLGAQRLILAEVQSQVGGAAAATATAGDKMRVAFSNLGEKIGTALLPYLDRASEYMTAKLLPAIDRALPTLAGLGRAAVTVGTSLGPTATVILNLAGSLAKMVAAAPPGVVTGVAVALLTLATGIRAVGLATAIAGSATKIAAVATNPWALALAAASVGIGIIAGKSAAAKIEVAGLTEAIKADSLALGENTRGQVVNALQKAGVLAAANRLGISLKTVTDAALGDANAQRAVADAMDAVEKKTDALLEAQKRKGTIDTTIHANQQRQYDDFKKVNGAIDSQSAAVRKAQAAAANHAAAMGQSSLAQRQAGAAAKAHAVQVAGLSAKIAALKSKTVKVAATGAAGSAAEVARLRAQIAALQGKVITIRTNRVDTIIETNRLHRARGGPIPMIPGASRNRDSVPLMGMPGEFMIDKYGSNFADAFRFFGAKGMHAGGPVTGTATGGVGGIGDMIRDALAGMTWDLRIDPQGLATVVARGQRANDRRG